MNAALLAKFGGGGTQTSLPLAYLNTRNDKGNLCIYVSDNESNIGSQYGATVTLKQWEAYAHRNEFARLICIDITPNTTSQAPNREDILNVGGFSDSVFNVIKEFGMSQGYRHWTDVISKIEI